LRPFGSVRARSPHKSPHIFGMWQAVRAPPGARVPPPIVTGARSPAMAGDRPRWRPQLALGVRIWEGNCGLGASDELPLPLRHIIGLEPARSIQRTAENSRINSALGHNDPPLLTGRSGNEAFLPSAAEPQPRLYESANRGGLRRERSAISSQRSAFGEKAHFTSIAVKSPNKPAKRCALPSPIAQSRRVSLTQLYLLHRESEVFRALQRKDSEVSTFNRRPLQRHHSTNFLPKRGEVTDEDSMSGAPV
jgi:hypothetical protein